LLAGCAGGSETVGEYCLVPNDEVRVEVQLIINRSDIADTASIAARVERPRAEDEPSATGELVEDGTPVIRSSEGEIVSTNYGVCRDGFRIGRARS